MVACPSGGAGDDHEEEAEEVEVTVEVRCEETEPPDGPSGEPIGKRTLLQVSQKTVHQLHGEASAQLLWVGTRPNQGLQIVESSSFKQSSKIIPPFKVEDRAATKAPRTASLSK